MTDHNNNEQAGIWNYQFYDHSKQKYTCHAYPTNYKNGMDITIDGYWRASRAFSCLTLIFGSLIIVINTSLLVYRVCFNISLPSPDNSMYFKHPDGYQIRKQLGGWLYLLACICSSLSLLFLKSNACQNNTIFNLMQDHQCTISTGAKCTYAAMALYFVAASILLLNERDTKDDDRNDIEDASNTEPLIQDVIFECEVSRSSSSSLGGFRKDNPMTISAMTWDQALGNPDSSERSGQRQLEESMRSAEEEIRV